MLGSRYSLNNHNPLVYRKDDAGDVIEGAGDVITDTFEGGVDILQGISEGAIDIFEDAGEEIGDWIEDIGESVEDFAKDIGESVEDFAKGVEILFKSALEGDIRAIATIAVIGFTGYYGYQALVVQSGLAGVGGAMSGIAAGAFTAGELVVVSLWVASTVATLYGIVMTADMIKSIGELAGMQGLERYINTIRNVMTLAFTNSWINGSMNLWMAGGVLYDSPRAGGALFNPTGDMNTTKFLGLQNKNANNFTEWKLGRYHDFQKKSFGNLAGSEFFAVSPIAQRM